MFHDDGEPAMLLFGPGAKVRALDAIGPYTRLQPGVPVGSAPVPNLPGLWMDKDGSLYFLSDGRRVWRIRDNREWMGEEIEDNSEELSTQCPYTRYSIQAAEEVPWKPASDDSTPIHEGSRTVHLPDVRSFGRLERDKWLAVKNLEESAELVEACKQWLKACDPTDPSGIGREFDDHANCLACYGVNVGGELGDDRRWISFPCRRRMRTGVTCRFVAMLILSSIRQAKQDRYRSRSFPMRHHYALRAQKT